VSCGAVHSDCPYDQQIVVACGEKPAYGYRRVAWWLRRKENLLVNRKRVLRVIREPGLLIWETDPSSAIAKDAYIVHFGLLSFIRAKEMRTCPKITFRAARILLVKMWQMFSLISGFREKNGAKRTPLVIMLSY
jgi:hypothetical protein